MLKLKDYKTLLGNTVAQPAPNEANGILKNATIVVPLKVTFGDHSKCHWLIAKLN